MAQVFSSLTRRGKPLSSVIVITLIFAVYKARNHFLATGHQGSHNKNSPSTTHAKEKQGKKVPQKVGVNSHFIEQMKRLLPICIPGMYCKKKKVDSDSPLCVCYHVFRIVLKGIGTTLYPGDGPYCSYVAGYLVGDYHWAGWVRR